MATKPTSTGFDVDPTRWFAGTADLFGSWNGSQKALFDGQLELFRKFTGAGGSAANAFGTGNPEEAFAAMQGQAEELGALCNDYYQAWQKAAADWPDVEGGDGVVADTVSRLLDPTRWFNAGGTELNETLQNLVEGPEFADIWELERKLLKTSNEWLAVRRYGTEYRQVMLGAWTRAFRTFMDRLGEREVGTTPTWEETLDLWLAVANEELLRTQRTDEFLDAQRKLLRASVDYRLHERELVELYCEAHSIPTRSEIDDLHKTVYELRKELRVLQRQQRVPRPAPTRRKTAAPRKRKPVTTKKKEG